MGFIILLGLHCSICLQMAILRLCRLSSFVLCEKNPARCGRTFLARISHFRYIVALHNASLDVKRPACLTPAFKLGPAYLGPTRAGPPTREPSVLGFQPIIDVFAHHVFCDSVSLLNPPFELVALSVDAIQVIFGELTPLLLDLALNLLPVSFDAIPIHHFLRRSAQGRLVEITFASALSSVTRCRSILTCSPNKLE